MCYRLESIQNSGYDYKNSIDFNGEETLISYYTRNYTHSSEDTWRTRIESGLISVNGCVVTDCSFPLKKKHKLSYHRCDSILYNPSHLISDLDG